MSPRKAYHPSELPEHLKEAIRTATVRECCHKTRLQDAPCPAGRRCPHISDALSREIVL